MLCEAQSLPCIGCLIKRCHSEMSTMLVYPHKGTLVSYYEIDTRVPDLARVRRMGAHDLRDSAHVIEHIDPRRITAPHSIACTGAGL